MSASEAATWRHYEALVGFPATRLEAGIALAGSAVARSMGSKVEPKHLLVPTRLHAEELPLTMKVRIWAIRNGAVPPT